MKSWPFPHPTPLHRIDLAAKAVAVVDVVAELHDAVGRRPRRDIDPVQRHGLCNLGILALAGGAIRKRVSGYTNTTIVAQDRKVENDFTLSTDEQANIKQISEAFHKKGKKLVIVLNIGGVIETASWRDEADAILCAWQPGLEGGNSITDVLSGKTNPSGKLATSFPVKYEDVPSAKNFPGRELDPNFKGNPAMGKPSEVIYEDGIYVGYRYYQSFHVKTAYPFGYGLSYSKFEYSKLTLSSASFNTNLIVSVTVTNTGKTAGKEVVELYLSAPAGKVNKPEEELKGFAKTRLLNPGESETVQVPLTIASLASFNTEKTRWIADAGKYKIRIGGNAEEVKLSKEFTLEKEVLLPQLHKVMVPQVAIAEIKP